MRERPDERQADCCPRARSSAGELGRHAAPARRRSPAQNIVSSDTRDGRRSAARRGAGGQAENRAGRSSSSARSVTWVRVGAGRTAPAPITPRTIATTARVLVAARPLVEHVLADDHQHEQAGRECGLDDDQRREHQRDAPAAGSRVSTGPCRAASGPSDEAPGERQAQVLLVGGLASRPSPERRSLGCRASTHRPRRGFRAPVPCPLTIIALLHAQSLVRSPGAAARRLPAAGRWPGAWPPLRAPLGIEDRTADGRGLRADLRRRPACAGDAGGARDPGRERVRATFFLVGEQIRRNPSLPREILEAGHEIALHCDRHRNLLRLGPRQVREDIARAEDAIAHEHGPRAAALPASLRRPQRRRAAARARARGWRTLLWSHWGRDWEARATPESIAAKVTAGAGRGRGAAAARRRRLLGAGLLAAHRRGAAAGDRDDARARARAGLSLTPAGSGQSRGPLGIGPGGYDQRLVDRLSRSIRAPPAQRRAARRRCSAAGRHPRAAAGGSRC